MVFPRMGMGTITIMLLLVSERCAGIGGVWKVERANTKRSEIPPEVMRADAGDWGPLCMHGRNARTNMSTASSSKAFRVESFRTFKQSERTYRLIS